MEQDWDELVSGALELAIKCLRSYDPSKGAFTTYYYRAAQNPFRYMIFKTQKVQGIGEVESLHQNHIEDDEESMTLEDMIVCGMDMEEMVANKYMSDRLHQAIEQLSPRLRRHAYDTLQGKVTWKNLNHTVEIRREMLEELRRIMSE